MLIESQMQPAANILVIVCPYVHASNAEAAAAFRGTGQELQHQKSIEPNLPYQFHALEAALHTASEAMGFEVSP